MENPPVDIPAACRAGGFFEAEPSLSKSEN
jgi:hypothetical protein